MKIDTVWGIFPVFLIDIPISSSAQGTTNACVIRLKYNKDPKESLIVYLHERVHVKQFYAMMLAVGLSVALAAFISMWFLLAVGIILLWWVTPHAEYCKETAAYAETARQYVSLGEDKDDIITTVAHIFDNSDLYRENKTFDQIRARIETRFYDKRIF